MRVRVYEVGWDGPGRLATMARPRGGDWLPGEMAALAAAGVQVLVSALCDDEMERLDLTGQPAGATLVRLGVSPIDAWGLIRWARGCPVPESRPEVVAVHGARWARW